MLAAPGLWYGRTDLPADAAATRLATETLAPQLPRVTVVTVGTPVVFPNSDNVRHQEYSFSPAKRFELPLYSGKPAAPVVFNTAGVVELGCNIHDWMVGYVYVTNDPRFAVSDAQGRLSLDLPPGQAQPTDPAAVQRPVATVHQ